ncbi:MAG: hypothetical protein WA154_12945 [Moraxellaceae bacterium]
MSIESTGGSAPTIVPGSGAGVASLSLPLDAPQGQDTNTATVEDTLAGSTEAGTQDTLSGGQGEDTLTGGQGGEDTLSGGQDKEPLAEGERSDDDIRASLAEAGGFYADPRYESAAIEFERTGDVSPETLAKVATEFNIPLDMAQTFVDGQKALRAQATDGASAEDNAFATSVTSVLADGVSYEDLAAWSLENLTLQERTAYNEALGLDGGKANEVTAQFLLKEFQSRFLAAGNGNGPRDVTTELTTTPAASGVQPYENSAQMQADMAKPQYQTDEAYRQQVQARLAKSNF